jgi:hypothetical protein
MKTTLQELISEMEQLKETKLYNLASFKAIEYCLGLAYEKLEMEKQQIIDAWNDAWIEGSKTSKLYYHKTFKQQ